MAIAEQAAAKPESSSAGSRMEVRTESPIPEASHRASQFGPLPLVLRPDPPTGRKVTRERRGSRSNRVRAIILCWWPGMFLAAGLWSLTKVLAQQKPSPPAAAQQQPQQQG